jgi:hypothetical protein
MGHVKKNDLIIPWIIIIYGTINIVLLSLLCCLATCQWHVCFLTDKPRAELPSLDKIRSRCMQQLEKLRPDHIRRLNPTPYKVCIFSFPLAIPIMRIITISLTKSLLWAGKRQRKAVWFHPLSMAERGARRWTAVGWRSHKVLGHIGSIAAMHCSCA